ncbi:MAG: sugar kinase [Candidatus Omnitrophica bacterium]|nr:sugar kinase [Candidatus Omnitrophota bacterium]
MLVLGTVALDTVETPFGRGKDLLGGSATFAAASASFFTPVKLVAIVGKDFPQSYLKFFQAHQINTQGLQIKTGKTFRWRGSYSYNLNCAQTLKTELNLLANFYPFLPPECQNEQFVFLANIDPDIQLETLKQLSHPKLIVTDTMNYWIEHKKKSLKKVIQKSDILVLNDAEAREFSQEANLLKAAKLFLALGPRLVIIKRGEYGCLLFSRTFSFSIPAYLIEAVLDPTGAGDSFAGGFLGYLASLSKISESAFKKAAALGTIMASYVVEDFSLNRLKKLTQQDIQGRFKDFQCLTRF